MRKNKQNIEVLTVYTKTAQAAELRDYLNQYVSAETQPIVEIPANNNQLIAFVCFLKEKDAKIVKQDILEIPGVYLH